MSEMPTPLVIRHPSGKLCPRGTTSSLALALALTACTLTSDDFEPALAADPLTPTGDVSEGEPAAAPGDTASPACSSAVDCSSGAECVAGACVARECAGAEDISACEIDLCLGGSCDPCGDRERSAGETDVDCGGACGPCQLGSACVLDSDCVNGSCAAGICADATCGDRLKNQDETGVDCGGSSCEPCGVGQGCGADGDCQTGLFCSPAALTCSPASCQDGDQNGAELGVDCGGGDCPGCSAGSPCDTGADCESRSCGAGGACLAATCTDGVANPGEADVDCGGTCSSGCDTGGRCAGDEDCASGVCGAAGCPEGVTTCCQAATCADGVQNGGEPSVDCGNATCGLCASESPCTAGAQCASGVCSASGTCGAFVCGDGVRNGLEEDVDCGGPEPGCPACPRCRENNSVDLGTPGVVTTLPANGCAKITQFPYVATLIESFETGPFPFGYSWSQPCSGQNGSSSFDRPYHQTRVSGFTTACPIIIDLQGSAAPFTMRWW